MSELKPPLGWTVTRERRQVATEDAASAFTDGYQWTVRDPDGQRPPQAEWPTAWYRQAVLYAHMMAARAAGADDETPPYAPSPATMDLLPRVPRDVDAVYLPRPHQLERLAEKARKANPDREPDAPDVVLARRPITELAELVRISNGARLVLGVTAKTPAGQLGPGWTWWARHGYGQRGRDGRITESMFLRVDRAPRSALLVWSRPVPDPRPMSMLGQVVQALVAWAGDRPDGAHLPMITAVLAQLPAPEWTSEYVTAWTTTATGRPEDIPRPSTSAAVKKEIRS
jgi:hypothetical protein